MERKLPISYLQQIGKITILQTRVCDINNSLTELKEKCSRLFKGQYFKQASKKRKQKQNKRKAKKAWATRMEANCKRVVETIAPPQESHDVREPIGPLSLHYEGICGLLKTQRPYIQYAFEKGFFTKESQDIFKQYLRFNLNENHDDNESNADEK